VTERIGTPPLCFAGRSAQRLPRFFAPVGEACHDVRISANHNHDRSEPVRWSAAQKNAALPPQKAE
jgi:hypothetical protein